MPKDLQEVAAFAPEDKEIAGMRIAPERFLNLERQAVHAAPHIGPADRQIGTPAGTGIIAAPEP